MSHRFVHLSDLHFGQEKHGTLSKHEAVRKALLRDVKELARKRGSATRILVTGDVTFSGKTEEFEAAVQWLDELTKVCGCNETDISTIPGNHDCDRGAISAMARITYGHLRSGSAESAQAQLHDIIQDAESASPFLPKLHAYRKFASAYGCDFISAQKPLWIRELELPGGVRLRLYGLTSVQVSNGEDALGKMLLGREQYTFEEEDNVIAVVMLHHPLSWFIDKDEASSFLCNRARVIMTGHEHALNVHKTRDAMTGNEWLAIYAGATNPPEKELQFTYNWLEFRCEEKNGAVHLIIETFPRVWIPEKTCFDADRNRIAGGAESIREELACPRIRFKADTNDVPKETVSAERPVGASVADDCVVSREGADVGGGGVSMVINDADFGRLRYLFWRYLDWQQRLKVLVLVDALPKTADQPLPQTLERVALDSAAKNREKLHKLWDEIMPLIPEEKRGTNPF